MRRPKQAPDIVSGEIDAVSAIIVTFHAIGGTEIPRHQHQQHCCNHPDEVTAAPYSLSFTEEQCNSTHFKFISEINWCNQ